MRLIIDVTQAFNRTRTVVAHKNNKVLINKNKCVISVDGGNCSESLLKELSVVMNNGLMHTKFDNYGNHREYLYL